MPMNDILNCNTADLWSILGSEEPCDPEHWFLCKGIGMIELCRLGEILGVDSFDSLMAGMMLVGEPRDEGPWPQTIPDALMKRLAAIADGEIAAVVPRWLESEQFEGGGATTASLTDYLRRLRSFLSSRSGEFFLVNSL